MRRFICRIIGLDEMRTILGFSILELTPREQEELAASMVAPQ